MPKPVDDGLYRTVAADVLRLAATAKPHQAAFRPADLAKNHALHTSDVEWVLERMYDGDLIHLSARDGHYEIPYRYWANSDSFFRHAEDGLIRVRATVHGERFLSQTTD
jgi:hypothetical protein